MQKSILITGCSSGIGLCAAEILKKRGYLVFATARKNDDLEKLVELGLECVPMDMDDSLSIQKGFAAVLAKTGGTLDALFNNAGFVQAGAIEDLSRDMMRAQFETNVFGAMELTNLAIPVMRKQGHGRIIQNTSILGLIAMPYRGAYNASKFALEGFSNTLRLELRSTGIFVSNIVPGPIHSNLRKNALQHYQKKLQHKKTIHRPLYNKMEEHYFKLTASQKSFTLGPDAVAKKLIQALESKRPNAHYYVTFSAQLLAFLHRILPDAAMDFILEKINRSEM